MIIRLDDGPVVEARSSDYKNNCVLSSNVNSSQHNILWFKFTGINLLVVLSYCCLFDGKAHMGDCDPLLFQEINLFPNCFGVVFF